MVAFGLTKWLIIGASLATVILFLREAATSGLGNTASSFGSGFGSIGKAIGDTLGGIGKGAQEFGGGIGSGVSSLFNPLFTLRDLIYGPAAGQIANTTSNAQPNPTGSIPNTPAASVTIDSSSPILQVGSINQLVGRAPRPLTSNTVATQQPTFIGTLTTPTGGSRQIQGSQALFDRLAGNIANSTNAAFSGVTQTRRYR